MKNFARDIAHLESQESLYATFQIAEILHKGFCDVDVELSDLEFNRPRVQEALEAVLQLIPQELQELPR